MNWLCIPGWGTEPDIFNKIIPEGTQAETLDLNFFNEEDFPDTSQKKVDGVICYSLGSLIGLELMELTSIKKAIFIGGFSFFPGEDKKRKLKINLMIRGLKKDPAKVLDDFYSEAGLPNLAGKEINVNNLIHGLELLRDCDMSHALCNNKSEIYTIHGDQDSIVPEKLNRMQFKESKHFSIEGQHSIILTQSNEVKKIISEII